MGKITYSQRSTSATTVLTSANLSGLADTARKLSGAQTNTTEADLYAIVELKTAATTAATTAGANVELYLLPSLDDSAFSKGSSAIVPSRNNLVWTFTAGSSAQTLLTHDIRLPPFDFKWILENNAGVQFSTGSNTLRAIYYTETVSS